MKKTVITLAGPTGAGKSAASLALAEMFPLTIINADSRQVYADFPLITAQPSVEEQSRCPHYLYGFLPCDEALGAGKYSRLCLPLIDATHAEKKTPLLVGGTGLYFKALFQGVAPIPAIDESIREHWQQQCLARGSCDLHAELMDIDPDYAAKIHPNDPQRITRALEVWHATGKTFSAWHQVPLPPSPYTTIHLGITLPLTTLEPILKHRIELMIEAGAIAEAEKALKSCPDGTLPGWSGIGCQELFLYVKKEISLDKCIELWYRNTRAYAKRQITWFKQEKNITWFAPNNTAELIRHVQTNIR